MKKIILFLILFFSLINISNADLIKPNSNLKPLEVLTIQLNSLKNNNTPYEDAVIEQTYEFDHPDNKKITGPLNKFKKMIYSDGYRILISHESNKITILSKSDNKLVYKVFILSKDKKKFYYIWQIQKVENEGSFRNCWMTTSVSSPVFLGEII